jgi:5-methyltetrahydropteroyltriglutamate--homocysteine methyltransferase
MMHSILTTTVGSYPVPDWLNALPSKQAVTDATRVVFDIQRQAGIDLPTDGELYRFDINHPDTNGMIEHFLRSLGGIDGRIGRAETADFRSRREMRWRAKPAAIVRGPITEGVLNLPEDCARAAKVAGGDFKFTLTSPYMLARTLLDLHYLDFEAMTLAIADALAAQVADLPCACVQVDEANIPGNPKDGPLAARAINRILDVCKQRPPCISALGTTADKPYKRASGSRSSPFSTPCTPITSCSSSLTDRPPTSTRSRTSIRKSASDSASWTSR